MINKFYIIRHGETEANAGGEIRMCGSTNLNLTHKGFWDAMYLGKTKFNDFRKVENIYVSELVRTKQTAFALFKRDDYITAPDLNEINFGKYEMTNKKYLPSDILLKWERAAEELVFEGGDSIKERSENIYRCVSKLMTENDKPFALVTSSTISRLLIIQLMGLDLNFFRCIKFPYLSIAEVEYDTEKGTINIKINT